MFTRRLFAIGLPILTVCAWQNSLSTLHLTREAFEGNITRYVQNMAGNADSEPQQPWVSRPITQAILALDANARAAVVKELGAAAKSFVMSPAFQSAYDAYLAKSHNAVDRKLTVKDPAAAMQAAAKSGNYAAMEAANNNAMRDAYRKGVQDRLKDLPKYTKDVLPMMIEMDMGMLEMSMPATAAEKANVAKAKTMLADAKKTATTDLEKSRATYKSALLLAAGMKDESEAAAGVEQDKKMEQQKNYNRLAFRPLLKKKLASFAAIAKTVDFAAQTTDKGAKKVFVNASYERKSSLWKMLYRLGAAPTQAAASMAQSWAAEL